MTSGPRMGTIEWLLLLLLAVLWGTSFSIIKVAVREVPPFTMVFFRLLFAAGILFFLMTALGMRFPRSWSAWKAIAFSAVVGNAAAFCLIVWGQQYIPSSLGGVLMATGPLFTLVIAHFFTHDERMTLTRVLALLLGFSAVVVMIGPDVLAGLGVGVLGQFAFLGAAACYAVAAVYGRRFQTMGLKPLPLAAGQMIVATLAVLPAMLLVERPWTLAQPSSLAIWAVIANGVLSTGLPYIIYFRILAVGGATNVMLVTFLVPVVAVVTGALALGELLDPRHFVAIAILAVALILIDGRLVNRLRQPTSG
ncbi:MAG: DMT family transporter, partial [Alphaproteobacteria bacterium]